MSLMPTFTFRWCFALLASFLAALIVLLVAPATTHAQALPCHQQQVGSLVPSGFGAPYSFGALRVLQLKSDCAIGGASVTHKAGNGSSLEYIYNIGYEWNGTTWDQFQYTGANTQGEWIIGDASVTIAKAPSASPSTEFYVGFVCLWTGTKWNCGCRDASCSTAFWQIQSYRRPPALPGGGSSGTGGDNVILGQGAVQFNGTAVHSPHVPAGYQLTFNDEFDGPLNLDPECNGNGTWAVYWCEWNVRVLWDNSERAIKTHKQYKGNTNEELGITLHEITPDGTLKLYGKLWPQANKGPFLDEPYYSEHNWLGGMISNEKSYYQKYGYWETRIKLNNISKGHHIAFWLLEPDGDWPPEIDLLEVVDDNGTAEGSWWFNTHGGGPGFKGVRDPGPGQWHILGYQWEPSGMQWYVNGQQVHGGGDYLDEEMYFLIAPEIGGNWPGKPDGGTQWPMEVEVDYVRIYSKNGPGGGTAVGGVAGGSSSGGSSTSGSTSGGGSSTSGSTSGGGSTSSSGGGSYVPSGYRQVWGDEFDTLSVDSCNGNARWGDHFCGWGVHHLQGNNDRAYKTSGSGLLEVRNGILHMYGQNRGRNGFPYSAGMITSQRSHSQTYGYWEIRTKITNVSKGHHIAYWLVPVDNSWPPEIDILEVVDDNGPSEGKWHYNSHGGGPGFKWDAARGPGFHTLGFEWTSSQMNYFVNGQRVHGGGNYVNKPMYLMIAPEIGGDWPGSPDGSTRWPMHIEIDWIRVYER